VVVYLAATTKLQQFLARACFVCYDISVSATRYLLSPMCIKNIQLPGHRGQKYKHLMQLIMIDMQ